MTPRVPGDKRRSDSKLQIANPILLASNHSIPSCHGTTEKRRRFKRNSRTNKHKTVMNNWRREIKGRHWLRHRKPWQRTYYSESEKKSKKNPVSKKRKVPDIFLVMPFKMSAASRKWWWGNWNTSCYDIAVHHTQRYECGNTEQWHIQQYFEAITLKQLV